MIEKLAEVTSAPYGIFTPAVPPLPWPVKVWEKLVVPSAN